ncbi:hypothetical protein ONZ45_g5926 [Pleurotus djamor]|nr:hypothetical protein ONZ45_g5926 [Pleurotus djamor]
MAPHASSKDTDPFAKGVKEEAGKQTVKYAIENKEEIVQNGEDAYEDAKAKAQGWWQRNCGCLGGSV